MFIMNRLIYLIDGFNLYHSVIRLKRDTGYSAKWLDIASLCKSYVYLFGKDAKLQSIYYFSALPNYLITSNPDKIDRHKKYLSCLKSTGVQIELGRFKEKEVYCDRCKSMILKHEEKETDVSIAIKLLEILFTDMCDSVIIVSGDTDLAPAVRKSQAIFSGKKVIFAFPFARKNNELMTLAPGSFSIGKKQYINHQLPNPVILKNGSQIHKPVTW